MRIRSLLGKISTSLILSTALIVSPSFADSFQAGDADRNCTFDSSDLVRMFSAGKYENGATATWSEGDFTGDGLFNSSDLVAAFQAGTYEQGQYCSVCSALEESTLQNCSQFPQSNIEESLTSCLDDMRSSLTRCEYSATLSSLCANSGSLLELAMIYTPMNQELIGGSTEIIFICIGKELSF